MRFYLYQQDVTILKLDFEHRVRKGLNHLSILFYCYLFRHLKLHLKFNRDIFLDKIEG